MDLVVDLSESLKHSPVVADSLVLVVQHNLTVESLHEFKLLLEDGYGVDREAIAVLFMVKFQIAVRAHEASLVFFPQTV